MNIKYIFLAVLVVLVVTGCNSVKSNETDALVALAETSTPDSIPVTVTSTPSQRPPIATRRAALRTSQADTPPDRLGMVEVTPRNTNTPAPMVEVTPRNTNTPAPAKNPVVSLPTLSTLDPSPEKYQLVEPDLKTLTKFFALAGEYRNSTRDMNWEVDEVLIENISQDSKTFFDAVVFLLGRQASLSISELLTQFDWEMWFFNYPSESTKAVDNLVNAIAFDIEKQNYVFEDQKKIDQKKFKITPYQIELDGDTGPEWLLQIEMIERPEADVMTWLVYDETAPSTYHRLEHNLPHFLRSLYFERKILLLKDFTGDNRTDILISEDSYLFGSYFTSFYVATGNKNGLKLINTYHERAYAYDGPVEIEIVEDQVLPEMVLRHFENLSWGCQWYREVTYRWPGGKEQLRVKGEQPPHTPECKLAKAVSVTHPVDQRVKIQELEAVIPQFRTNVYEQKKLTAFAYYQLALLYGEQGREDLARASLEKVISFYSEDKVTQSYFEKHFQPLLAEEKLDLIKVCSAGYGIPSVEDAFPTWVKYINSEQLYQSYPGGEPVPDAICPLLDLVDRLVQRIQFNGEGSPEQAIKDAGLPIQSLQPYIVPGGDRPAWFVVLDMRPYIVLANFPLSEKGFTWQRMDVFTSIAKEDMDKAYPPTWLNKDVTGDGIPELVIAKSNGWACDKDGQISLNMHITGGIGGGRIISIGGYECLDVPLDLEKWMGDYDGDGLSDVLVQKVKDMTPEEFDLSLDRSGPPTWFTENELMQNFYSKRETPSPTSGPDLEEAMFMGENPAETRRKLERLRDGLSPDEPAYENIIERCEYLIALSYELEGNTDEAIRRYLALAQDNPQTYWSNLAAARLALK